jgi:hypothetical protein
MSKLVENLFNTFVSAPGICSYGSIVEWLQPLALSTSSGRFDLIEYMNLNL